ncbi:sigma-70 family RNA polymerase sigma factor [Streptomyces tauricus]|uniref:Sigma-70 family RNA polymerase sigma factor n=1 Tax=Streptomyces tauricus TaxID=68274 RepID=A0ABZ1JDP3_9ACTN|nr:sigma-70 family RNA polymerase sigma factor [Streptomyces tauricus]
MTHSQRFRDIYEECYPRVLAYTTSLVGRQVGEDITSETFTVAWRRVRDLPQPALPWLLGVARNLVREMRRRDSHQYLLAAEEARRIGLGNGGSGGPAEVGDVAADVTDREAALQALAGLSDADRELLTLIAWHGLSTKQAARVLGCTTATLTVRLHRARRRLEKALEPAHLADTAPARRPDSAPQERTPQHLHHTQHPTRTDRTHRADRTDRTDRRGALT